MLRSSNSFPHNQQKFEIIYGGYNIDEILKKSTTILLNLSPSNQNTHSGALFSRQIVFPVFVYPKMGKSAGNGDYFRREDAENWSTLIRFQILGVVLRIAAVFLLYAALFAAGFNFGLVSLTRFDWTVAGLTGTDSTGVFWPCLN